MKSAREQSAFDAMDRIQVYDQPLRARAPARGGVVLTRLPEEYVDRHLAGRPNDPRVTYCTYRNVGRKYPYASQRQNKRNDWRYERWMRRHSMGWPEFAEAAQ